MSGRLFGLMILVGSPACSCSQLSLNGVPGSCESVADCTTPPVCHGIERMYQYP